MDLYLFFENFIWKFRLFFEQCSFIETINQKGADLDYIRTFEVVHIAYNLRDYIMFVLKKFH